MPFDIGESSTNHLTICIGPYRIHRPILELGTTPLYRREDTVGESKKRERFSNIVRQQAARFGDDFSHFGKGAVYLTIRSKASDYDGPVD